MGDIEFNDTEAIAMAERARLADPLAEVLRPLREYVAKCEKLRDESDPHDRMFAGIAFDASTKMLALATTALETLARERDDLEAERARVQCKLVDVTEELRTEHTLLAGSREAQRTARAIRDEALALAAQEKQCAVSAYAQRSEALTRERTALAALRGLVKALAAFNETRAEPPRPLNLWRDVAMALDAAETRLAGAPLDESADVMALIQNPPPAPQWVCDAVADRPAPCRICSGYSGLCSAHQTPIEGVDNEEWMARMHAENAADRPATAAPDAAEHTFGDDTRCCWCHAPGPKVCDGCAEELTDETMVEMLRTTVRRAMDIEPAHLTDDMLRTALRRAFVKLTPTKKIEEFFAEVASWDYPSEEEIEALRADSACLEAYGLAMVALRGVITRDVASACENEFRAVRERALALAAQGRGKDGGR